METYFEQFLNFAIFSTGYSILAITTIWLTRKLIIARLTHAIKNEYDQKLLKYKIELASESEERILRLKNELEHELEFFKFELKLQKDLKIAHLNQEIQIKYEALQKYKQSEAEAANMIWKNVCELSKCCAKYYENHVDGNEIEAGIHKLETCLKENAVYADDKVRLLVLQIIEKSRPYSYNTWEQFDDKRQELCILLRTMISSQHGGIANEIKTG